MKPAGLKLILCSLALLICSSLQAGERYNLDTLQHEALLEPVPDELRNGTLCGFSDQNAQHPEYLNSCSVATESFSALQCAATSLGMAYGAGTDPDYVKKKEYLTNKLRQVLTDINLRIATHAHGALRSEALRRIVPGSRSGLNTPEVDVVDFSQSWKVAQQGRSYPSAPLLRPRENLQELICNEASYTDMPERNMLCNVYAPIYRHPEVFLRLRKQFEQIYLVIPAQGIEAFLESQTAALADLLLQAKSVEDRELEIRVTRLVKRIMMAVPYQEQSERTALIYLNQIRVMLNMPRLDLRKVGNRLDELSVEEFVGNTGAYLW